jgi:pyruvate/2-oxoglutarate dehydrogenase complex dihydrolipoamide acyltransferase (E2) component
MARKNTRHVRAATPAAPSPALPASVPPRPRRCPRPPAAREHPPERPGARRRAALGGLDTGVQEGGGKGRQGRGLGKAAGQAGGESGGKPGVAAVTTPTI